MAGFMQAEHKLGRGGSHFDANEAEFSMTPMIDCVFQLLIFFMVTTVFPEAELLKIELPSAVRAESLKRKEIAVKVLISAQGEVDVNGLLVPFAGLVDRLSGEKARTGSNSIYIKADAKAPHGLVVDTMYAARLAGIEKISVATERAKEGGG